MPRIVGIDPGLKGGLVLIAPPDYWATPMPTRKGNSDKEIIDALAIAGWLMAAEPDLVVVEHQGARNTFSSTGKAQRRTSAEFRYATGYGKILGVLESMKIRHKTVRPQVWKRDILPGTDRDKNAAIAHVQRELPCVDLKPGRCRTPQDGLADAACIALWGVRRWERIGGGV